MGNQARVAHTMVAQWFTHYATAAGIMKLIKLMPQTNFNPRAVVFI